MILTLIGGNRISRLQLPEKKVGDYWVSDINNNYETKLINVVGSGDAWKLYSNENFEIINSDYLSFSGNSISVARPMNTDVKVKTVRAEEYGIYVVQDVNKKNVYVLFCTPTYEEFSRIAIKNANEITIGRSKENNIIYNNLLINEKHTVLNKENNKWYLTNLDTTYGTFINGKPVDVDKIQLENGNIIYIVGLKIIVIGNTLFINNPSNKVYVNSDNLSFINQKRYSLNIEYEEPKEEEKEVENEFSRIPRITSSIEKEQVKIDAPPAAQNRNETPLIFTIGMQITMGLTMMMSMVSTISNSLRNDTDKVQLGITITIAVLMLISMLVLPMANIKYDRYRKKRDEEKRQKKYKAYIDSKIKTIDNIMEKQRKILSTNLVEPDICENIVLTNNTRLWERKIEDPDFMQIRLGLGRVPLDIDIQYPEDHFMLDDDNLVEILSAVGNKSKTLENAPISLSIPSKRNVGIISGDRAEAIKYLRSILIQLVTFQNYEDLKILFFLDQENSEKWQYIRMLPHVLSNEKNIRFIATSSLEKKDLGKIVEELVKERTEFAEDNAIENVSYKNFSSYYLIITDCYKEISKLKGIAELLNKKIDIGIGMLSIANDLMQLPNECKTFIVLNNSESGKIMESELLSTNQNEFVIDKARDYDFDRISQILSNIPIKFNSAGVYLLPENYGFLEMFGVGKVEQLNVLDRWKNNDSIISLQTPIGIDDTGNIIKLDIHEKYHGPHGLIAGSTGSGKSEFIISYILSLAVNYHPDDVTFLLIDYKGGGLAGAFKKNDIVLPHLVGTLTNIDKSGLQRTLDSIQSELRRRQVIFNEARNSTNESTIDIYKYQSLYHDGLVKEAIPHLLIICDEFAELKQQQEEFMDELISVARIGRSLGVHLILATQKPSGIVDEQIRSNSKFGVSLKVQDTSDSNDVIKRPDAAFLKNVGQFYLNVGNDEYFTIGQSAYSGRAYEPKDISVNKQDNSIEFISNTGDVIKRVDDYKPVTESDDKGDELTNIVKYLYNTAKENNIKAKQLWLENIPENIYLEDIRKKYNYNDNKDEINVVVGEYDDPYNQKQGIVTFRLEGNANTIIYGNADSGKDILINSIIYDGITHYSSKELQYYILDFASETLKVYKDTPHIGDVIFSTEEEKIFRFLDFLKKEIKHRKVILSDYNGDYELYKKQSENNKLPEIVCIISGFESFSDLYIDKYEETFIQIIRECTKCGILFIITANNRSDVRYRFLQYFKNIVALQLNSDDDYNVAIDGIGKKRPSPMKGRGLVEIDETYYEFQTARIVPDEELVTYLRNNLPKLADNNPIKAVPIRTLDEEVKYEDIKDEIQGLDNLPIGISKATLNIYKYNFSKNYMTPIIGKSLDHVCDFVKVLMREFKEANNNVYILDSENKIDSEKRDMQQNYNFIISKIKKETTTNNVCVIVGISKVLNEAGIDESTFSEDLQELKEKCIFIIADSESKIKDNAYDTWYSVYINADNGIWIGKGIEDQYQFNFNRTEGIENDCDQTLGVAFKSGNATMIKLVGIKQQEGDYE